MTSATAEAATVRQIHLELVIDAPRERVWEALTTHISLWWHKDFFTGPNPQGFHLQPKLGGWMFEDWGDGAGLIWGTVIGVRAPAMLQVVGDSGPDFGGPNRGFMTWSLEPVDGNAEQTTVRFVHALHGNISEQTRDSLDGGWRLLFEQCLKPFAETGERPAAADGDAPPCNA